ncbi:hypothetical protein ACGF5C_29605 [Micromonospora sp. NPDC047620]|uniref:hypothetical protein n=1 Tax=Micromonospora sp. NPDC047620 TaxID=3364251 RepID=UPI0037152C93
MLNHATTHGFGPQPLARFQQLPVPEVEAAIDTILDTHLAVTAAGYIAVHLAAASCTTSPPAGCA